MSVDVSIHGHRADIVLRRPDVLNAMNWEVFTGLAAAADKIAGEPDVRVMIVSGEGRSFSAGIDVKMLASGQGVSDASVDNAQAGFRKIAALPMPTIAAVQGHAFGAGFQLALACDLRVVTTDATMGLLEANYALVPDLCGTQRLPLLAGEGVAKKMIWLAERIDGREAHRLGIAELLVEPSELENTVDELAQRIAAAPPTAVRLVKQLVGLAGRVPLEQGMDAEADAQLKTFASPDLAEAMTALVEKRPPHF